MKHFFCNVAVILKTFIIHLLPIYHFANNLFPWKKKRKKRLHCKNSLDVLFIKGISLCYLRKV